MVRQKLKMRKNVFFSDYFSGGNNDVLTFFEPRLYKIATAFMLAWPYGNHLHDLIDIF